MKSILIVDDDPNIVAYMRCLLHANQYHVVTRSDGKSGLKLARQLQPDLILCDVVMPCMSGYEVLDTLKTDSTTANIPFIFLTSNTSKRDIIEGIELGATQYLSKPINAEDLLACVATHFLENEREHYKRHNSRWCSIGKSFHIMDYVKNISEELENSYRGWWLAFHPQSDRGYLGKTQEDAFKYAQRAHPNGIFVYQRIGTASNLGRALDLSIYQDSDRVQMQ